MVGLNWVGCEAVVTDEGAVGSREGAPEDVGVPALLEVEVVEGATGVPRCLRGVDQRAIEPLEGLVARRPLMLNFAAKHLLAVAVRVAYF